MPRATKAISSAAGVAMLGALRSARLSAQQRLHGRREMGALRDPRLDRVGLERDALRIRLRVEAADDGERPTVALLALVHHDDVVVGAILGAGARESDLHHRGPGPPADPQNRPRNLGEWARGVNSRPANDAPAPCARSNPGRRRAPGAACAAARTLRRARPAGRAG